jgi:hypothetical protein
VNHRSRFLFLLLIVALLVAVPSAAFASKRLYKARLASSNELHTVVDSTASGASNLAYTPDSVRIVVNVRGLSGPATGMHLHAPADTTQNAGVVITLCGAGPVPAPACPWDGAGGLSLDTTILPSQFTSGVTGAELRDWLDAGLVYINVHTALNPAGETRGQFALQ